MHIVKLVYISADVAARVVHKLREQSTDKPHNWSYRS